VPVACPRTLQGWQNNIAKNAIAAITRHALPHLEVVLEVINILFLAGHMKEQRLGKPAF